MNNKLSKKVLLITPDFPPVLGGIQNLLYNVCLYSRHHEIYVIAPKIGQHKGFDALQPFEIHRVPSITRLGRNKQFVLFALSKALQICKKRGVKLIYCGHIVAGITGLLLKRLCNLPYIVHTYALEIMQAKNQKLVASILQNADRIITISEFTKAAILKLGVNCGKIRKVLPGICLDEFHPDVDASGIIDKYNLSEKKVILTIGRLDANEQYKGQDMVIKAMPDILHAVPSAVYAIGGDGSDRGRLENLAKEVGVADKVLFTGWIPEAEKPAFYAACEVFAMPSREMVQKSPLPPFFKGGSVKAEGFGIVYIEANACGKPVVGGKSGGVPDAVIDGVTGLLVEPNSPKAIGDAIIKLLTDAEMSRQLGENGRKRALRELSAEKMAQNIEAVFQEV